MTMDNTTSSQLLEAYEAFNALLRSNLHTFQEQNLQVLETSLCAAVVRVRRQRNQPALLNRLPEEILTSIFLHVRDSDKRSTDENDTHYLSSPPDTRSLLAITRVCHRMREIALRFPSLWSVVPPSVPYGPIFAERSGCLALKVHAKTSATFECAPPPLFRQPHCSRIKELYLVKGPVPCDAAKDENVLSSLAPSLEYLNLAPDKTGIPARRATPTEIFSGSTPEVLRALSVSLKTGLLPVDNYPSLTHLRLSGPNVYLQMKHVLQLLSNTPLLETLYIVDAVLILASDWSDEAVHDVQLERLKTLRIDNSGFEEAFAVVRHLTHSPDVMIQLHHLNVTKRTDLSARMLPSSTDFTTLEVAEEFATLHFRAKGPRSGFWAQMHLGNPLPDVRQTVATLMANAAPALASVEALRIGAGRSIACNPNAGLLNAAITSASSFIPKISNLIIAMHRDEAEDLMLFVQKALSPERDCSENLPLPALQSLGIQIDGSFVDHEPLVEVLRNGSREGRAVRNLLDTGDCADALLWHPEKDVFWKAECPYWSLYREEEDASGWPV